MSLENYFEPHSLDGVCLNVICCCSKYAAQTLSNIFQEWQDRHISLTPYLLCFLIWHLGHYKPLPKIIYCKDNYTFSSCKWTKQHVCNINQGPNPMGLCTCTASTRCFGIRHNCTTGAGSQHQEDSRVARGKYCSWLVARFFGSGEAELARLRAAQREDWAPPGAGWRKSLSQNPNPKCQCRYSSGHWSTLGVGCPRTSNSLLFTIL